MHLSTRTDYAQVSFAAGHTYVNQHVSEPYDKAVAHICRALVNADWRRQGYDYDALYDDGLMKKTDKEMIDFLNDSGPMLTSQMKKELGFCKDGKRGFDAITNRLQMQTYIGLDASRSGC